MKIVNKVKNLRTIISGMNGNIGYVPTMGYLHEGHAELIRKSVAENDVTIVSIYVNPAQFGKGEDLDKYPRDPERDAAILKTLGVDLLFIPDNDEIYPAGYKTYVNVRDMDEVLCGESRPGHFTGVATIVLKFLNMINPWCVYLGKKDAQQLIILKKMINDLNLSVEVKSVDIKRDVTGLALSSRNSYLSDEGKKSALALSNSLNHAASLIKEKKVTDVELIKREITAKILEKGQATIDYVEIVSLHDLEKIDQVDLSNTLIAVAAYVENVRLIDNLIFGEI